MKSSLHSVTVEYPFGSETWVPGETETLRWSAYGGDPNTFTIEFSNDGGGSWSTISNSVPSTARSYAWTVPASLTNQALIRITRNGAGYSDISDYPFTILNSAGTNGHQYLPGICAAKLEYHSGCRFIRYHEIIRRYHAGHCAIQRIPPIWLAP